MLSLKGKLVLITGGSSGIGRSTAIKMAELGADVLAVARRMDRLKELTKVSTSIKPIKQDLLQPLDVLRAELQGRTIDILVNNAGLALGREGIQSAKEEDWNTMIDTNIKALISVTQLVLPKMIEKGAGDIVNLGSIAGYFAYAGGSVYNATKFAVRAMTEAWRQDLSGKGIRVIGIHPGMVETEFSLVRLEGDAEKAKKVYAGMDPLTADDIADSIIWSVTRPRHVNIQSMVIMPTDQASINMVHRKT
jgi:3-hydroxy acid dehydrogenase/malonic semialdehyde reductase